MRKCTLVIICSMLNTFSPSIFANTISSTSADILSDNSQWFADENNDSSSSEDWTWYESSWCERHPERCRKRQSREERQPRQQRQSLCINHPEQCTDQQKTEEIRQHR